MLSVPPGELGSGVDTGMVTSISLLFTNVKLPRVDEAKGTPSRRTWEPASKPVPRIFTGPTAAGAAPNVIFTAGARFAGVVIFVGSSMPGVATRSMCTGLILPSLKPVRVPLPEFTVKARLLTESTAMAPGMDTFVGVVEAQFAAQTVARPFWPVVTMAGRCKRVGSSSETSLVLGLKETTVLEKGWKATSAAPSSGGPELTGPVSSAKSDIEPTDSLWGSMKVIWLEVAFGSARTAWRVTGLKAIPVIDGEIV